MLYCLRGNRGDMPDIVRYISLKDIINRECILCPVSRFLAFKEYQDIFSHDVWVIISRFGMLDEYSCPPHPAGDFVPNNILMKIPSTG